MAQQDEAKKSRQEPAAPNKLVRFVSALLAPLGIEWAKRVQEQVEEMKREAERRLAEEAKERGESVADSAKPS